MIHGIGVDIVQINRIEKIHTQRTTRFVEKILAKEEFPAYEQHKQKAHFLAKRFAAKEAFAKALGTGFTDGLIMPDIIVEHTESGQPYIKLKEQALFLVELCGIRQCHLSLSDEQDYAVAHVVLEK